MQNWMCQFNYGNAVAYYGVTQVGREFRNVISCNLSNLPFKTRSTLCSYQVLQGFVQLGPGNIQGWILHSFSRSLFHCLSENLLVLESPVLFGKADSLLVAFISFKERFSVKAKPLWPKWVPCFV